MSSIHGRGISIRSCFTDRRNGRKRWMTPNRIEAGHGLMVHSNSSDAESEDDSSFLDEVNRTATADEIDNESLEDLDQGHDDNHALNDEYGDYERNDTDFANGYNQEDVSDRKQLDLSLNCDNVYVPFQNSSLMRRRP